MTCRAAPPTLPAKRTAYYKDAEHHNQGANRKHQACRSGFSGDSKRSALAQTYEEVNECGAPDEPVNRLDESGGVQAGRSTRDRSSAYL